MPSYPRDTANTGLTALGLDASARVLIVGAGKTGLSVARFLRRHGIEPAVADSRENPPGLAELRETLPDVAVFLGGFDQGAFLAATHLVVSPGVALEEPALQRALGAGVPVLGDLDLFAATVQAPVIAITGANGKSTVTTLVGLMAQADGRKVRVGGNLGTPMLDLLDAEAELYVLELSSFQLERAGALRCRAATVLNISPDHLDRYPDLQAYVAVKQRIFAHAEIGVLNADDPLVAAMAAPVGERRWFSLKDDASAEFAPQWVEGAEWLAIRGKPLLPVADVRLQGRHNLANALAAMALADAAGILPEAIAVALRQFRGLDHRMQFVAEIGGVMWVNDSKATNVGACIAALQGLPGKAVLIAGGDGKGADFSMLAEVASEKVRAAVLMGRDAHFLEQVLGPVVTTVRVPNMKQAVEVARRLAEAGDTVLLAPACASLDQYRDYQERGRVFVEAVKGLLP